MAGKNLAFKEGDILFKQGDPADSMYLVRKGSLTVYIKNEDGELPLATLDNGAIVGEMAFFDQKPRSASVRASQDCEVTQITKADFDRLLQQVPKWMVTMMQSLSGRLRSTNERVQKLEEAQLSAAGGPILPNQRYPFQIVHKTLRGITLALMKDGEKEGREHVVPTEAVKNLWDEIVGEDNDIYFGIIKKLQSFGLITLKKNSLKQDVLAFQNRGIFMQFTEFLGSVAPRFSASSPFLSKPSLQLFQALVETTSLSGYESLNVNINELLAQQKATGADTSSWSGGLPDLVKKLGLKLSKNGQSILVKVILKEHKPARTYLDHMAEIQEAKLI